MNFSQILGHSHSYYFGNSNMDSSGPDVEILLHLLSQINGLDCLKVGLSVSLIIPQTVSLWQETAIEKSYSFIWISFSVPQTVKSQETLMENPTASFDFLFLTWSLLVAALFWPFLFLVVFSFICSGSPIRIVKVNVNELIWISQPFTGPEACAIFCNRLFCTWSLLWSACPYYCHQKGTSCGYHAHITMKGYNKLLAVSLLCLQLEVEGSSFRGLWCSYFLLPARHVSWMFYQIFT